MSSETTTTTTTNTTALKPLNLFDYTEEQLLEQQVLTHYQVLGVEHHVSVDGVKKAYRKASLKYHPDKTGRGDDDYVFLAVKRAYDVLSDHTKRSAYDSTTVPFDDSIPPPRSQLIQDPFLLYKDEDFYELFGPVFLRNLRFDANLRPDAVGKKKKQNGINNSGHGNTTTKGFEPPSLGDDNTPMEEVHKFYEYWIHFDSWRDFTAQATDELQVENELENAESRFEKRWLQKEVDKRAKQLKTKENGRIQTLVERAMEADPRLRRERQALQEAKERVKADRAAAVERKKQEEEEAKQVQIRLAEEEKIRKAEEKVIREQEKKLIRKARQQLRRMTSSSFESEAAVWADTYDMSVDVDFLCNSLTLDELKNLNEEFEKKVADDQATAALSMVRERALVAREAENAPKPDQSSNDRKEPAVASTAPLPSKTKPWTKDELSALAKGVKKYPPGGASRWDQIALFVNNLCKQDQPRSKEECIQKYNDITKSAKPVDAATTHSTTTSTTTIDEPLSTSGVDKNNDDSEDVWTPEQDQALQNALAQFPATMEKNARWTAIADAVPDKSKKQCVQRFKTIREALLKNRK